jgi:sugar lactone lactonase YvrE
VDLATNDVYVADTGNQKIKKIAAGGGVTTLAGTGGMGSTNGPGASATFTFPRGLVFDGSTLYVTDTESNMVRKIDLAATTHDVSTYIGDGATVAPTPGLTFPFALAIDGAKSLYLAEQGSSVVRKIDKSGVVTLLGGTSGSTGYADGAAASSKFDFFNYGAGLAVAADGTVYVADSGNVVIRAIKDGQVSTFAGARVFSDEASHVGLPPGDGPASSAKFNAPIALAIGADGALYVADRDNNCIRRIKR